MENVVSRPAQPILPVRPWSYLFSGSTTHFSFKKLAHKTADRIGKPKITAFCSPPPIHRPLKLNHQSCMDILNTELETGLEIYKDDLSKLVLEVSYSSHVWNLLYLLLCQILFGLDAYDKTKDTLGTVFYSSGSILVPRYIVSKAKFV